MANFKTLYGFELRKLLARKLLWVTFGLLTGIVLLMTMSTLVDTTPLDDGTRVSRYAQQQKGREICHQASGMTIDETTLRRTVDLQYSAFIMENGITDEERQLYALISTYVDMVFPGRHGFPLESYVSPEAEDPYAAWAAVRDTVSLSDILYQERRNVSAVAWDSYFLSESAKTYWQKQEETLQTPFVYQYAPGWQMVLQNISVLNMIVLLLAATGLAAVFSDESIRRTDQLLLSSRHGRGPLYIAKWAAGATLILGLTSVLTVLDMGINFALYGTAGAEGVIQLSLPFVAHNLTYGGATAVYLGLMLVAALMYSALALFLSELLQNSTAVLAAVVGPLTFCYFYNIDADTGLKGFLSQLLYLTPSKIVRSGSLSDPRLVPFPLAPGGYLTNLQAGYVLYPLCIALLAFGGWQLWKRHQVSAR